MVERRNRKRKTPQEAWRVFNRKTGDFIGHVANISTDGLMIRSEGALPIDIVMNLRIETPVKIDGTSELICDAISMWCDRGSNPRFHNTGLQLLNITERDIRVIERLVELCPV